MNNSNKKQNINSNDIAYNTIKYEDEYLVVSWAWFSINIIKSECIKGKIPKNKHYKIYDNILVNFYVKPSITNAKYLLHQNGKSVPQILKDSVDNTRQTIDMRRDEIALNIAAKLGCVAELNNNKYIACIAGIPGYVYWYEYEMNSYQRSNNPAKNQIRDRKYTLSKLIVTTDGNIPKIYKKLIDAGKLKKFDFDEYREYNILPELKENNIKFADYDVKIDGKIVGQRTLNNFDFDSIRYDLAGAGTTRSCEFIHEYIADDFDAKKYNFKRGIMVVIPVSYPGKTGERMSLKCIFLVYYNKFWNIVHISGITKVSVDKCSIDMVKPNMHRAVFGLTKYRDLPVKYKGNSRKGGHQHRYKKYRRQSARNNNGYYCDNSDIYSQTGSVSNSDIYNNTPSKFDNNYISNDNSVFNSVNTSFTTNNLANIGSQNSMPNNRYYNNSFYNTCLGNYNVDNTLYNYGNSNLFNYSTNSFMQSFNTNPFMNNQNSFTNINNYNINMNSTLQSLQQQMFPSIPNYNLNTNINMPVNIGLQSLQSPQKQTVLPNNKPTHSIGSDINNKVINTNNTSNNINNNNNNSIKNNHNISNNNNSPNSNNISSLSSINEVSTLPVIQNVAKPFKETSDDACINDILNIPSENTNKLIASIHENNERKIKKAMDRLTQNLDKIYDIKDIVMKTFEIAHKEPKYWVSIDDKNKKVLQVHLKDEFTNFEFDKNPNSNTNAEWYLQNIAFKDASMNSIAIANNYYNLNTTFNAL